MAYDIRLSTAVFPLVFPLVQSSDHITPLTGATVTVTVSKNGGNFAGPAGAVSEIGSGLYKVAANATDSNTLGPLWLHATAGSADPTDREFFVVGYDPTAANLPANVLAWNSTSVAAPATAGIPDVNVKNIANAAVSTTVAQIGVNAVAIAGQAAALDANNLLKVDVEDVNGSATVEIGVTWKQAMEAVCAALAGVVAGAGTTTVTISAINNAGTTRIVATVDASGNRSAVALSL